MKFLQQWGWDKETLQQYGYKATEAKGFTMNFLMGNEVFVEMGIEYEIFVAMRNTK